jgi:hypothetical protein
MPKKTLKKQEIGTPEIIITNEIKAISSHTDQQKLPFLELPPWLLVANAFALD